MKICIDCRLISEKPTGISRLSYDLIRFYSDQFGNNNVICIVNKKTQLYGYNTVETQLRPFNLYHFFKFRSFVKDLSVDLLHSPFYSSLYRPLPGLLSIVTLPDLMYRFIPGFFGKSTIKNFFAKFYFDIIVSLTLKSANKIISISNTTSIDLFNWLKIKSKVIYPVVEVNDLSKNLPLFAIEDFFNKHSIKRYGYFLYVGNNRPHKNLEFLVNEFVNSNSNYDLILVGHDSPQCPDSRVKAIGPVSDEMLYYMYKYMACFVFTSKYEGFGLPLIEASLIGKRILASDIPVFRELENSLISYISLDKQGHLKSLFNEFSLDGNPKFNEFLISSSFSFKRFSTEIKSYLFG